MAVRWQQTQQWWISGRVMAPGAAASVAVVVQQCTYVGICAGRQHCYHAADRRLTINSLLPVVTALMIVITLLPVTTLLPITTLPVTTLPVTTYAAHSHTAALDIE